MIQGLIFTILIGLFFLIGIVVLKNSKNKKKLELFTISLAAIVLLGLIVFDLLPELIETRDLYLIIPALLGFVILVLLDKLIPHHHHEHTNNKCDKNDHEEHLNHIGVVTIIALSIHNMIEGLSLYSVTINNIKSGILMMIAISLHNIPLGFQIGNSIKDKKYSKLLVFYLCISSFLGAILFILFGSLNEVIINILLSLTLGMLIYILIFELISEIKHSIKRKEFIYGTLLGIIIIIISLLI